MSNETNALRWAGLEPGADRESIIGWLVWNDGNGCYSDEDHTAEWGRVMTRDEAIECIVGCYVDSRD